MFMYGTQLTNAQDVLRKVNVNFLYKEIIQPDGKLFDQIRQLRSVKMMDEREYKKLKVILPYFVCGVFTPPYRRKENFAYTEHFVVDIDHISRNDQSLENISEKLKKDDRVMLMFVSPGKDGLKLMFRLNQRIADSQYFTYFYKKFCISFAEQYQLYGILDSKTCDVSRCCFMSYDTTAYYNPLAEFVNAEKIVSMTEFDGIFEVEKTAKAYQEKLDQLEDEGKIISIQEQNKKEIDDDVISRIRMKLNPDAKKTNSNTKEFYVPTELDESWQMIEEKLREADMIIESNRKISYGRQVKIRAGKHWCEINIFYGEKGFSVIKTTKTGSNEELAALSQQYLQEFLTIS